MAASFLVFALSLLPAVCLAVRASHPLRGGQGSTLLNESRTGKLNNPNPNTQRDALQLVLNSAVVSLRHGEFKKVASILSPTAWVMPSGRRAEKLSRTSEKIEYLRSLFSDADFSLRVNVSKTSIFEALSANHGVYMVVTHCTFVYGGSRTGKMIIVWDMVSSDFVHSKKLTSTYVWSITWIIWNFDSPNEFIGYQRPPRSLPKHPISHVPLIPRLRNSPIDTAGIMTAIQDAWVKCLKYLSTGDFISASHLLYPKSEFIPPNSPSLTISNLEEKMNYFEKYFASGYTLGVTLEEVFIVELKYVSGVSSSSKPSALVRSSYLLLDRSASLVETGILVQLWTPNSKEWSFEWSIWNCDWKADKHHSFVSSA